MWQIDLLCSSAPAAQPLASAAGSFDAAISQVLGGQSVSEPAFKHVHMASLISRFEMQSGISHDGKAYDAVRRLEELEVVTAANAAEALRVFWPYLNSRANSLRRGWLPLKVRNFKDRSFLWYDPLPAPYRCGSGLGQIK